MATDPACPACARAATRACADCRGTVGELQPDRTGDLICLACHCRRRPLPLDPFSNPPDRHQEAPT